MTECEAADEDSNSGKQAVKEVENPYRPDADEVEERPLHTEVCEGLVQAFVDPVPPTGCNVCLHRRPSQLEKSLGYLCWYGLKFRLHTPKPGQNVGGEHGNARAGGDTGQSLLGARLAVRELVAANHDCDQTGNLGNRTGEEGLHSSESCIERRLRQGKRREKD
jgi:hypothetical protein